MSKIFKIFFFCCSKTDEAKQEVESEDKQIDQSKAGDKTSLEKEIVVIHRSHSEEKPEVHHIDDSSESCSISSGEVS
jgi:hypothetical protein